MNRRKHPKNNRKDFPLSVDLRNFIMYSNPARFAPKLKQTGGEAYPQTPTMDQFFDYGHPTPQTPFVFQNGGMNDIQKMNAMYKSHYMQNGGTNIFSDPKPNRTSKFLDKIKKLGYDAIHRDMQDEEMQLQDGYNRAAMQMDHFQYGGGYDMDFSAANQWADAAQNTTDMGQLADDFGTILGAYNSAPTETYIKSIKTKQMPAAQYGLGLQTFQGDFGSSQYNSYEATRNAERLRNLPATKTKTILSGDIPMPGFYTGPNSFEHYIPGEYNVAPSFDKRQTNSSGVNSPFSPTWQPFQPINNAGNNANVPELPTNGGSKGNGSATAPKGNGKPKGVVGSTADQIRQQQEEEAKKKEEAVATPPEGTQVVKNADGTESAEAKRREEEAKKTGAAPEQSTAPEAGSKEEANAAAAAGMTPAEYRTFLTRATVNNRRAILPGNRLKSMDFYFDTYGPGMNPVTASVPGANNNQQGPQQGNSEDVPGGRNNQQNQQAKRDGFFGRLFGRPDEQSRWNPENDVHRFSSKVKNLESPVMESQFETQGYSDKNYLSDARNEMATNRLNRLGQRIDRNMQREMALDKFYGAPISDRMQRLRDRDLNRYNRIANRFDRDEYVAPAFQYGGYYQDGGEDDPFGTAGYSTDGSDMTEREDYMGNTMYQRPPMQNDINQSTGLGNPSKSRTRVKFGHYNPYEAPLLLAGVQGLAGARRNAEARKNQGIFKNKMSADQVFTAMPDMSRGDYTTNEGYFRPNEMVPVEQAGYNFKSAYAKMGGSYKKGGEYYLSEDEINELIQNGGQVEYLD
jgi:hypothetical protein